MKHRLQLFGPAVFKIDFFEMKHLRNMVFKSEILIGTPVAAEPQTAHVTKFHVESAEKEISLGSLLVVYWQQLL